MKVSNEYRNLQKVLTPDTSLILRCPRSFTASSLPLNEEATNELGESGYPGTVYVNKINPEQF